MTPAETLNAAADLIERLAGDATPGPWMVADRMWRKHGSRYPDMDCWIQGVDSIDGTVVEMREGLHPDAERSCFADAAYIAAMNPAVAILLVPVLRAEARHVADMYLHAANPNLLAFAQALIEGASK